MTAVAKVPQTSARRLRRSPGAARMRAQNTGRLKVKAITSARAIEKSMECTCDAGFPCSAGITNSKGTRRFQSPEGASVISSEICPPARSRNSIGSSSANHHSTSSAIISAEAVRRKRVCGLLDGIRHGRGSGHQVDPHPKNHHRVQNEEALPQISVGKLEPAHAVLADIE